MPVFIPEMAEVSHLPPHERLLSILDQCSGNKAIQTQFRAIQMATSGFIIVSWRDGKPYEGYEGSILKWFVLGSDTNAEYPQMYGTIKAIIRNVRSLREHEMHVGEHIGIAFWIHPESHLEPLDFVAFLAAGKRFPGSPKQ